VERTLKVQVDTNYPDKLGKEEEGNNLEELSSFGSLAIVKILLSPNIAAFDSPRDTQTVKKIY